MNFPITKEDFQSAQFHMLIEILACNYAIKDMLSNLYAAQTGIESKAASEKIDKMIEEYKKGIHYKIDEQFGHLDLSELKKY